MSHLMRHLVYCGTRSDELWQPKLAEVPQFESFYTVSVMSNIWSMKYYGEKKLTESKLPEPFANIKDDFLQVKFVTVASSLFEHSKMTLRNYGEGGV